MPDANPEPEASSLEELRRKLYANQAPESFPAQTAQTTPPVAMSEPVVWQAPAAPTPKPKRKVSWSVIFLGGALVVFLSTLAIASYFLLFGGGAISTDNIDITVAPVPALRSGEVATFLVTVKNNNRTTITNTRLSASFPESARDAKDPLVPYPRFEDTIGDMAPGESRPQTIQVVLSGAQGETYSIPLKLEYKTEGSNAVFVKEVTHDVTITSSPLSVTVGMPAQASDGQEIAVKVTVHSDSKTPIENVAVLAEYPFGFIPAKTGNSTTLFDVGTVAPGGDVTITVRGSLTGADSDERVFRFKVGTKGGGGLLALTYGGGQGSVRLTHPFLATTVSVNGDTGGDIVVPAGKASEVRLSWVNTLPTDLTDAQITVKLTGEALDSSSVIASGGFYRSVDSTVLYARDNNPGLARLVPNAIGNGSFTFSTKSPVAMKNVRNPAITAVITITGRTSTGGNAPTPISATMTRTIQVGTELGLTARASRTAGTFKNTGPIPPKPDVESTYTMMFSLTSTVNSVAGTVVRATLPSYVRFVGATSPNDGSITYDENTRTVTWAAGEVAAGTSATSPKQGAFQVALLPSSSQRGTSPILMSGISYSGTDRFTRRLLEGTVAEVTTQTTQDPGYQPAFGEVAR